MGLALLELGQTERALVAFDRAVALHMDGNTTLKYHHLVGARLRDMGRYPEAITHLEQALRLAQAGGQASLAQEIESALDDCRADTPPGAESQPVLTPP